MNSPIGREKMVKLFSSVLRLDDDGFYYLVTPVEKIKIEVEDRPFVITTYNKEESEGKIIYFFKSNVGEIIPLNSSHPIKVKISKKNQEPSPYILVRKNLEALISRNVFYQLVEEAELDEDLEELFIFSSGSKYSLGKIN